MGDGKMVAKLPDKRPQIRGLALEKRIQQVILALASKAKHAGRQYIYNASETARLVPTTRKSLAKHEQVVARVLQDLEARRRMATGEATAEHLRDQVAYLREQIVERERKIAALLAHHIEIYRRFHEHSLEAELLIRPVLEKENEEAGECVFCGSKPVSPEGFKRVDNLIKMRPRKRG